MFCNNCGEQREKAVKYIEDIEVTCEIFEEISNIRRVLEICERR